MIKLPFFLVLFLSTVFNSNAQVFTSSATMAEKPSEKVGTLTGEELDSDAYKIDIYLSADQAIIDKLATSIGEKFTINGNQVSSDIWLRYEKTTSPAGSPALKVEVEVDVLILDNAHIINEKGNTLKFDFINERDNDAALGSYEVKFDIPGFNNATSEFCHELLKFKSKDPKVDKTLHTIFKAVYPHTEIVATLMDSEWRFNDGYDASNTYMVIFKNKGKHWMLRYSASYPMEDGERLPNPRVKIYNGLDDPIQISDACVKALMSTVK